jgi:S-layer homology domain
MTRGRRFLGQLVLVLVVMAAAFVGAKLGMLGTREVGASHNFSDVPDSAFYHDFVQFLVDNGITAGCAPSLFCGEQAVTRGQTAVFLKKVFDAFEIVRNPGGLTNSIETTNVVGCPTGKRPLAGGGTTSLSNLFVTDIAIGATSLSVRWESDNNASLTGTTEAWALCAPA